MRSRRQCGRSLLTAERRVVLQAIKARNFAARLQKSYAVAMVFCKRFPTVYPLQRHGQVDCVSCIAAGVNYAFMAHDGLTVRDDNVLLMPCDFVVPAGLLQKSKVKKFLRLTDSCQ
ncbi:hypothetical protein MP228_009109 [Amoeboaphelidium protococcarum]|nr:hypothetical protein MP228_009109 [Amoeboaphelidium protococcarum]